MSQHPFRLRQFRSKKAMDDARVSLDPASPRHVAIIMDGNGRWANARGLPRTLGHRQGAEAVRRCVAGAIQLGIPFLTLFGFSSENWRRPTPEVEALLGLLRPYLQCAIAQFHTTRIPPTLLRNHQHVQT